MIKSGFAEAIVVALAPANYWPQPNGELPGYLLSVEALSKEKFKRLAKELRPPNVTSGPHMVVEAANMGEVSGRQKWYNRFLVIVDGSYTNLISLMFAILHSVGHIDWTVNKKVRETWPNGEELYADIYAFMMLEKRYGEEKALAVLNVFGSPEGWGKNKGKKNA
jgi:hypothetical protein